jgi:hypothetical protein
VRLLTVGGSLALLACMASLYASAPAPAATHADDVAATQTYLRANLSYARSADAELARRVAALEARASEIATECPSALTYAPRDTGFRELTEVTEMAVVYADIAPVHAATLRLAQAIVGLSWSSSRLTRLVRSQALAERASAELALPDVCADIAAWRASAFATVPPSVTGFLALVQPIEAGVGPSEEPREAAIARLLRPYEDPVEQRTARRVERLEVSAGRPLGAAIAAARHRLATALGVSAL